MRVINLLPWREALYKRRRKNFVMALVTAGAIAGLSAFNHYWQNSQQRTAYIINKQHLAATLATLEQQALLLQQTSIEAGDVADQVQSLRRSWTRDQQWLQLMSEWQLLSVDAQLSKISWNGDELLMAGSVDVADPLRWIMQRDPRWQLQQIELDAEGSFQFMVSRTLFTEEDL